MNETTMLNQIESALGAYFEGSGYDFASGALSPTELTVDLEGYTFKVSVQMTREAKKDMSQA